MHGDEWFVVYCFAKSEEAETFRQKFNGEKFYPEDRGRGSSWWQWNKREREPKKMLDTAKTRKELIEHLEAAIILADEVSQPVTAYLIDRALDEARGQDWGLKPHEKEE